MMHKALYIAISWCAISTFPDAASGCKTFVNETTEIKVYIGWPLTLKCKMAIDEIYYYDDMSKEVSPINCLITDLQSGTLVLNTTQNVSMYDYRYDEDMEDIRINVTDATTKYQIFVDNNEYCRTLNITLRKIELVKNESCEANMETTTDIRTVEVFFGQNFLLHCNALDGSPNIPGNMIEAEDFGPLDVQVQWLFGCTDMLPNNSFIASDHVLRLENIRYSDHIGVYSCMVTYNGMTRYRNHLKLCVLPKNSDILSAKCTSQVAEIGSNVSVECHIDAGVGASQTFGFKGYFEKISELGSNEEHFCHDKSKRQRTDDRISCLSTRNVVEGKTCFDTIPTEDELERQKTKFTFVYTIKVLKKSDFGEYIMTYFRSGNVNTTARFTIHHDRDIYYFKTRRALIIVFVVLVVTSLFILLLWIFFRIEIQWAWQKVCKPPEKGSKKYAAYLAYHYSKDMMDTAPSFLDEFIILLDSHIQKSGAKTFDSSRDSSADEYKVDSVSSKLGDCQRVIILLTPEYISDQWGVHEAYEAWKTAIEETGIKIIFFVFPTTLRAINELPKDLKTALHQALKRHKVIHWNGKLPISRKLWMKLDILMPKLVTKSYVEMDVIEIQAGDHRGMNREDSNFNAINNKV